VTVHDKPVICDGLMVGYPRMQKLFGLTEQEIELYVQFLQATAESVDPVVKDPVVVADPTDDSVIYTAVDGRADIL
jgi:predicted nucleic acid-binding protein